MMYWLGFLVVIIALLTLLLIIKKRRMERLLILNWISGLIVMGFASYGVYEESIFFLDLAIVYSMIGFFVILMLCQFMNKGGRER